MNKVHVETDYPVAVDSPDHQEPWGTANDNNSNPWFNHKLFLWVGNPGPHFGVLDIGCSGGGFVKSLLDAKCKAVGIEGSDFSLKRRRAEWATIPHALFTADATKPYAIYEDSKIMKFDLITAWEFIEHIREIDIAPAMENIEKHLKPQGVVIMSISPNEEIIEGTVLHQTVQPQEWWLAKFEELGWKNDELILQWFGDDHVRNRLNAPNSFHVALTRANTRPPRRLRLLMLIHGMRAARNIKRKLGMAVPNFLRPR